MRCIVKALDCEQLPAAAGRRPVALEARLDYSGRCYALCSCGIQVARHGRLLSAVEVYSV